MTKVNAYQIVERIEWMQFTFGEERQDTALVVSKEGKKELLSPLMMSLGRLVIGSCFGLLAPKASINQIISKRTLFIWMVFDMKQNFHNNKI